MKANINSKKNSVKENNSGIILSIGMIIKNEEKVLERCLKSLQPLMEAIPSELIIADTGSTDSSVEIATKYTDNVFHFEWINDFAAARNSTLEKAKGQWFMFVDADEYLDDDIGEMVHFFKNEELRSKYKTLEIMVRSYTNEDKTDYSDGCLARLHRIDNPAENIRFVGSVHEGIYIRYPLGYFSTILHHTGYCFSNDRQNLQKKNRNLALMREEYKKNPKDLRMLSHLIDGCAFEKEECDQYIAEAFKLIKMCRTHLYSNVIYMQAVSHFQNTRPEYALELCDEFFASYSDAEKCITSVSIALFKAKILTALARYSEAYNWYEKYFELYDLMKNDKLDITDSSAHPIIGTTENEYMRMIYFCALTLKNLKKYDEGFALLNQFDISEIKDENFKEYLGTIRELCKDKRDYTQLSMYYEKINKVNDKNRKSLALYMMESSYYSLLSEEERRNFANDIVMYSDKNQYAQLMKLVLNQENNDKFKNELFNFINNIEDWSDGYCEAIYMAIKYKIDISNVADRMKCKDVRGKLEKIASSNDDFAKYVYEYGVPESYTENIKRFYWITSLYEKASYYIFGFSDLDKHRMYERFTMLLGDYVSNIYCPDVLNDEDSEVLPQLHKFGYFMREANSALATGDKLAYIRNLKKALVSCESMKEIVKFLLEQFKKSM